MTAAEMTAFASQIAQQVTAGSLDSQQGIIVCGMAAAKIASDSKSPDPNGHARLLQSAFNAAMFIESGGKIETPNRAHLTTSG